MDKPQPCIRYGGGFGLVLVLVSENPKDTQSNPYKLPSHTRPIRYSILLEPDLVDLRFNGTETIEIQVDKDCSEVKLNSVALDILAASITSGGKELAASVHFDPEMEIVTLRTDGTIQSGEALVKVDFSGELWAGLAGFYHSVYTDADGNKETIATTQFEATDARRAFPCFDEPELKAVFSISIRSNEDLMVVSNYPEKSSTRTGDGKKLTVFEDTMVMSSYLVAFVIGNLEASDTSMSGTTPIRVITPNGKGHLGSYAHLVADHSIKFFTEWFGIAYPAPKMDLLAIPDFAAGAMENLGAITFREADLLIDPESASMDEQIRVTEVICHEIAHMWFGDLVTMKWWNGIWLNEAFATYMSFAAVDAFRPDWRVWERFGIMSLMAQEIDSLATTRPIEYPVIAPSDADGMFDLLTYEKGGSILRMLEQYLGLERFRAGIRLYLQKHAYANAETTDLWDALEEASGEPVRLIMDTWVFQGGHPTVSLETTAGGFRISQQPFRYLSRPEDLKGAIGDNWQIPVGIRTNDGTTAKVLLSDESLDLSVTAGVPVINADGSGFYRSHYDQASSSAILSGLRELSTLERLKFVSDSVALWQSETLPLANLVEVLRALGDERDPTVLAAGQSALSMLNRIATPAERPLVATLASSIFSKVLDGFGMSSDIGDSAQDRAARAIALDVLGTIANDVEVRDYCFEAFRMDMAGDVGLEPDQAGSILHVVSSHGDETEFAFILDRYRHPSSPQDEMRFLYALTGFSQAGLASRLCSMALGEVRTQDAPYAIARALANRSISEVVYRFIETNFTEIKSRFPENSLPRMLSSLGSFYADENYRLAPEVRKFVGDNPLKSGSKTVDQAMEKLEVGLRVRGSYAGRLAESLK